MAEVSVSKVVPGSILARDVTLASGAPLIRAGVRLTDRQLQFLKNRGVMTVFIEDQPGSAEVSDSLYAQRCGKLDRMFASVQDNPHMTAIRDAARTRLRLKRPWE